MPVVKVTSKWKTGFLKEPFMQFNTGQRIFYKPTPYRHALLGTTYWLTDGKTILHVAEELAGKDMRKIVRADSREVNQEALSERVVLMLSQSVYAPSQRKKNTRFYS